MIKVKASHALLYALGIFLLLFGQRNFWEEIMAERKEKELEKKLAEEARTASEQPFETQELAYDSIEKKWHNPVHYFQTLHVGKVNFKALKKPSKTQIETHDDEDASDSR